MSEKTLKEQLIEEFNLDASHFGSHCSDLHILYSNDIIAWLRKNYQFFANIQIHYANVQGHEWYGKKFIDVPFAHVN